METFNIKFVGEVEKHRELYDYSMLEYSRKDCTEEAWNAVAKEVDLSGTECKEKWRNLRSTFARNLKAKPRGSAASKKKPYYLAKAMEFVIPFLKVANTPVKKLPETPQQSAATSESTSDIFTVDDDSQTASEDSLSSAEIDNEDQDVVAPSPKPMPTVSSPESTSTEPRGPHGEPVRSRKRQRESDADKAIAEYFSAKKDKLLNTAGVGTSRADKKEESIKNFLLSQIPDLLQMTDQQLRAFKTRSLMLIDEILTSTITDPLV